MAALVPHAPPLTVYVDRAGHTLHTDGPWLLDCLADGDLESVTRHLVPEGGARPLAQRLTDPADGFDLPDALAVGALIITALTGLGAGRAMRLASTAREHWAQIAPWAASHGHDLHGAGTALILAITHAALLDGCEKPQEATSLNAQLDSPAGLPGALHRTDRARDAVANSDSLRRLAAGGEAR